MILKPVTTLYGQGSERMRITWGPSNGCDLGLIQKMVCTGIPSVFRLMISLVMLGETVGFDVFGRYQRHGEAANLLLEPSLALIVSPMDYSPEQALCRHRSFAIIKCTIDASFIRA